MLQNQKEYLVVSRANGTTRKGDPYCTLRLRTADEELTVAVWDTPATSEPRAGQLVTFSAIQDNDGKHSARRSDMHPGQMVQEGHPLYGLLPHAVGRAEWDRCVEALLGYCTDERLKPLIAEMAATLFPAYSKYPAATAVHHAFRGGLLNHTYQMLHMLEGLYPVLPYPLKVDRCVLAILFHDYGKVYEYTPDGDRREGMYLLGHIYISANRLQGVLKEHDIDQAEADRIVHIILSHHGQMEYGSPVLPCTQEAVVVHLLDNLSAKTDNIASTAHMERSPALSTNVIKD